MEFNIKLTENLILTSIHDNPCDDTIESLVGAVVFFTFYGTDVEVFISMESIHGENPDYVFIETVDDLSESCEEQLHDLNNWSKIVECVKIYHAAWKIENEGGGE